MNDCKGIIGKMFGHKFHAVYDESLKFNGDPAMIERLSHQLMGPWLNDALKFMKDQKSIYVHHVCKRCGYVIKREVSPYSTKKE